MGLPLFMLRNQNTAQVRWDFNSEVLIAAASEEEARALMSAVHFYEDGDSFPLHAGDEGAEVWIDPAETPAEIIAHDSVYTEPTVVMKRFHAG